MICMHSSRFEMSPIGKPAASQSLMPLRRGTIKHVGHDTVAMAMVHAFTMESFVLAVRH